MDNNQANDTNLPVFPDDNPNIPKESAGTLPPTEKQGGPPLFVPKTADNINPALSYRADQNPEYLPPRTVNIRHADGNTYTYSLEATQAVQNQFNPEGTQPAPVVAHARMHQNLPRAEGQIPAQNMRNAPAQQPFYAGMPQYAYNTQQAIYPHSAMRPAFALRPGKSSTVHLASRELNRMAVLCVIQTTVSVILQVVIMFIYAVVGIEILGMEDSAFYWINAITVPLATLLPSVIYLKKCRIDLSDIMLFRKVGFLRSLMTVFAGLAICLLVNFPAGWIQRLYEEVGYNPPSFEPAGFDPASAWVYILAIAILAPIFEEFVFRGVIFKSLQKFGTKFAIIASSLLFGLAHMEISSVIFASVAGFVFAYLYHKTKNLWIPIAVHFLNNGIVMFQTYSEFIFGEKIADLLDTLLFMIPIIIGLLCLLALLLFRKRSRTKLEKQAEGTAFAQPEMLSQTTGFNAESTLRGISVLKAIAKSVGFWCATALTVIYMVFSVAVGGGM